MLNDSLTESQMAMWKSLIVLVWADNEFSANERKFLKDAFGKLKATQQQRAEIEAFMEQPAQEVDYWFEKITVPRDRSHFVYMARLLFLSDNKFAEQESAVFARLSKATMAKVDMTLVQNKVREVANHFQDQQTKKQSQKSLHRKWIDVIFGTASEWD